MTGDWVHHALEAGAWLLTKGAGGGLAAYAGYRLWDLLQNREQTARDWYQHATVIGGTGSGKTNALKHKAREAFDRGWSVWWLAVQRRSAEELLSTFSETEADRITWICPYEPRPLPLNLLACHRNNPDEWSLIAEQTVAVFEDHNSRSWGANIAEALGNAVYAVLEWAAAEKQRVSLWDAVRLLTDETFRDRAVGACTQPAVQAYFASVFPGVQDSVGRATAKVLRLLRNNNLLRVLASPDSVDVADLMNRPGIRFVVADMHELGSRHAAALYLAIWLSKLEGLAYSRGAWARPCVLFCDEFPLYCTQALVNLAEQGRRHNISLWLACQGTWQGEAARATAWQTGTWHIFRPQVLDDLPKMARALEVEPEVLRNLPNLVSYSRELIRGVARCTRRIQWPVYPTGSEEHLEQLKALLKEQRAGLPPVDRWTLIPREIPPAPRVPVKGQPERRAPRAPAAAALAQAEPAPDAVGVVRPAPDQPRPGGARGRRSLRL